VLESPDIPWPSVPVPWPCIVPRTGRQRNTHFVRVWVPHQSPCRTVLTLWDIGNSARFESWCNIVVRGNIRNMDLQETEQAEHITEQAPSAPPPPAPALAEKGPWFQYRVPHGLEWNRYILPIPALPPELEGLRVAQITDLHLRKFWSEAYDQLIDRVRKEAPDLILITGDFVDSKRNSLPAMPTVKKMLAGFTARLGCFGILGNHDRYVMAERLAGSGVTLIDGRSRLIEVDGAELELLGLPGVTRKDVTAQVLQSYPQRRFGVPRLILSHYPDALRKAVVLRPDIFFAGHTHGGQICLPSGFPPIRHDSLPRAQTKGVHRVADTWLVVSRGIGFTTLPFRIFCPAEVVEITLTRG
jgi:uncharacterized protein